MYLVFAKLGLEFFTEEPIKPEEEKDPIIAAAAEKLLKIQHATFELTLMQHVGGEVKNRLQRKLSELRGVKPKADGYEAWNALTLIFQGAGSTQKHMWITRLYDFKMLALLRKRTSHGA